MAAWKCRGCGCTEEHACKGGFHWVAPNWCSACAAQERDRKLAHPRKFGKKFLYKSKNRKVR